MVRNKEHKNNNSQSKYRYKPLDLFISGEYKLHVPAKTSREHIWNSIYSKVIELKEEKNKSTFKFNFSPKYQLISAASVIILIGCFFFFNYSKPINYQTQHGELITITLPDQSEVTLNADSRMVYKRNVMNGSREVYLTGEAIFNVTKGKSFTVFTSEGSVNVLGTRFNVFARERDFKVSCFSGKVLVRSENTNQKTILKPGKETRIDSKKALTAPYEFNSKLTGGWVNGEYNYSNANLMSVFKEIERQFNVKILCDDIGLRHYTGSFNNDDLEQALDLICIPMNLEFSKINTNTILIKKK